MRCDICEAAGEDVGKCSGDPTPLTTATVSKTSRDAFTYLRKNQKALHAHACSDAQDYSKEVQAKMMHHDYAAIEETRRRDATFFHLRGCCATRRSIRRRRSGPESRDIPRLRAFSPTLGRLSSLYIGMSVAQAVGQQAPTRTHLTLKGSTALVHEFFNYSVQSILYQRSIYPSDDFRTIKKFGLQMLATTDEDLADYLDRAMQQLKKWLEQGKVRRLVVAIVEKETQETVERWQFDVEVLNEGMAESDVPRSDDAIPKSLRKTDAQVKAEMAAIIKQITASCTFLPVLEEPCAFQILAYTDRDVEVPVEWSDSHARLIAEGKAEQVKLRSFSTHVHRVDAMVAYRREDDI